MTARTATKDTIENIIARGNIQEIQKEFKIIYDSLNTNLVHMSAIEADCLNTLSSTCAKSQIEKNRMQTENITMRSSLNKLIQTGHINPTYDTKIINPPMSFGGSKRKTTKGRRKQNKSRRRKSRR